ncbi:MULTISPECIES: YbaK/EbsC family protein [unclassified Actinotalea]|uniref:YbaK/EbsC family protein n=1 Tax=unclassified Actinotalea TaxID=2638618 RepID=UPI0015F44B6B|nr:MULTISPECIES: YbaK/EbsC family protein [unclassified Actinotalea]
MPIAALDWTPALDRPDLLAPGTTAALTRWADADPAVAAAVRVAEIDPDLADTVALTAAYGLPLDASANCVLVAGRRAGEERVAAAVVLASTRADVNNAVKRLLDVRKASFMAMDRAVEESGMEYGGITPIGLPQAWRVLVDARVRDAGDVVVGSGLRRSKLTLPGALLGTMPAVEVVQDLGLDAA